MRNQFVPSPTALLSAAARVAHCLYDDHPHLVDDMVAVRLCEKHAPQALHYHQSFLSEPVLAAARLSACMRRRFAESVAKAQAFSQCLLLGGGLDTTMPHIAETWVVDKSEVIAWREELFTGAGIADNTCLLPVDLGGEDLARILNQSDINRGVPVLVVWLGVSMYLDRAAIERTLRALTVLPQGSTVVFDYILSASLRDDRGTHYVEAVGAQVAGGGEPWKSVLTPKDVSELLSATGWQQVRDIPEDEGAGEKFWPRTDGLAPMNLVRFAEARLTA